MRKSAIFRGNKVLHLLICTFGVRFCGKIGYISCEPSYSFAYIYIQGEFFGKGGITRDPGNDFATESR